MKTSKIEFAGFLARLALALPKFAPNIENKALVDAWYGELGHLDVAALRLAFKQAVTSLDSFPSIRQVLAFCGSAPQSDEDKGREVAERIYTALTRGWASARLPDVIARRDEFVGPIGCEVVKLQGGWGHLSEVVVDDQATTWKAQWRELATIIVRKGGMGDAPDFEQLPSSSQGALTVGAMPNVISLAKETASGDPT